MVLRAWRRYAAVVLVAISSMVVATPGNGLATQDETELPSDGASDRRPSFERPAPAGALRLGGEPPAIGDVIVEESLMGPGIIPAAINCSTGRNRGEFSAEGYVLRVTGRCTESSRSALVMLPPLRGLSVPDGEVRLEAKVVGGHERGTLWLVFRGSQDPVRVYSTAFRPATGAAVLQKEEGGAITTLASRGDLGDRFSRDDWNAVGVRLDGDRLWVLLNDELVLSASDAAFGTGFVTFGAGRVGEVEDEDESAVVFRNLRVSALAPRP